MIALKFPQSSCKVSRNCIAAAAGIVDVLSDAVSAAASAAASAEV